MTEDRAGWCSGSRPAVLSRDIPAHSGRRGSYRLYLQSSLSSASAPSGKSQPTPQMLMSGTPFRRSREMFASSARPHGRGCALPEHLPPSLRGREALAGAQTGGEDPFRLGRYLDRARGRGRFSAQPCGRRGWAALGSNQCSPIATPADRNGQHGRNPHEQRRCGESAMDTAGHRGLARGAPMWTACGRGRAA